MGKEQIRAGGGNVLISEKDPGGSVWGQVREKFSEAFGGEGIISGGSQAGRERW